MELVPGLSSHSGQWQNPKQNSGLLHVELSPSCQGHPCCFFWEGRCTRGARTTNIISPTSGRSEDQAHSRSKVGCSIDDDCGVGHSNKGHDDNNLARMIGTMMSGAIAGAQLTSGIWLVASFCLSLAAGKTWNPVLYLLAASLVGPGNLWVRR